MGLLTVKFNFSLLACFSRACGDLVYLLCRKLTSLEVD